MDGNSPYILRSPNIITTETTKTKGSSTNTDMATPEVLCSSRIQATVTSDTCTKNQNNCLNKKFITTTRRIMASTRPIMTHTTVLETTILPNVTIRQRKMPITKSQSTITRAVTTQITIQLEIDFYLLIRQMAIRFKSRSR